MTVPSADHCCGRHTNHGRCAPTRTTTSRSPRLSGRSRSLWSRCFSCTHGTCPALLAERFEALREERGYDYFEMATTQQSKVGGYPGWTQEPDWPNCAGCGTRMKHLLSISATEPGMGRWLPLDDRDPSQDGTTTPCWTARADPAALDTFGYDMDLGDLGGMYFFICRSCPDTPYTHRYDC